MYTTHDLSKGSPIDSAANGHSVRNGRLVPRKAFPLERPQGERQRAVQVERDSLEAEAGSARRS